MMKTRSRAVRSSLAMNGSMSDTPYRTWLQITRSAGATTASSQVLATTVMFDVAAIIARMPSDGSTAVTHSSRSDSGTAWRPVPAPASISVLTGERYGSITLRNSSARAWVDRAKLGARPHPEPGLGGGGV